MHPRRWANLSDSAFIDKLYTNALNKTADASGKAYWLAQLQSRSRATVVYDFINAIQHSTDITVDVKLGQKSMQIKYRP